MNNLAAHESAASSFFLFFFLHSLLLDGGFQCHFVVFVLDDGFVSGARFVLGSLCGSRGRDSFWYSLFWLLFFNYHILNEGLLDWINFFLGHNRSLVDH